MCLEVLLALPLDSMEMKRLLQDVKDSVREGEHNQDDASYLSCFVDSRQLTSGVEITEQHSFMGIS